MAAHGAMFEPAGSEGAQVSAAIQPRRWDSFQMGMSQRLRAGGMGSWLIVGDQDGPSWGVGSCARERGAGVDGGAFRWLAMGEAAADEEGDEIQECYASVCDGDVAETVTDEPEGNRRGGFAAHQAGAHG